MKYKIRHLLRNEHLCMIYIRGKGTAPRWKTRGATVFSERQTADEYAKKFHGEVVPILELELQKGKV